MGHGVKKCYLQTADKHLSEMSSEPCQTSKMVHLAKVING